MQGLTPLRFQCVATTANRPSYQNMMIREEDSVYCVCTFSRDFLLLGQCTVVGDYCVEQQDQENSNSSNNTSV